jgi:hypothetical protein
MIFIAVVAFAACMLCYGIGRQHGERATMAAIREAIPNLGVKRPRVGDEITVNGVTWKNAGRYRESHNNNNR